MQHLNLLIFQHLNCTKLLMFKKIPMFCQFLLILVTLSHCGIFSEAADPLNQKARDYERYGDGKVMEAVERSREGRSSFMDLIGQGSGNEFKENIIFNVALDKISFMPLQSSDQLSGVITTEWFQTQGDLNNRIKLVIYVKSDVIDDASLDVKVFKEIFDGKKWNVSSQNSELAIKIKRSILDTAQNLAIANEMS